MKIKKEVKHQNIGGKKFKIEKEFMIKDILDTNFDEMPIAMSNFIRRRMDLIMGENENIKVYYGHVIETNLGYFIAEDEIQKDKIKNIFLSLCNIILMIIGLFILIILSPFLIICVIIEHLESKGE